MREGMQTVIVNDTRVTKAIMGWDEIAMWHFSSTHQLFIWRRRYGHVSARHVVVHRRELFVIWSRMRCRSIVIVEWVAFVSFVLELICVFLQLFFFVWLCLWGGSQVTSQFGRQLICWQLVIDVPRNGKNRELLLLCDVTCEPAPDYAVMKLFSHQQNFNTQQTFIKTLNPPNENPDKPLRRKYLPWLAWSRTAPWCAWLSQLSALWRTSTCWSA